MKESPYSWIGRLYIIKMVTLPKLIYRLHAIHIKIPAGFFAAICKLILKFIWKFKEPRLDKQPCKRTKDFEGVPDFKIYYEPTVI